jgi:hypothetical protein
MLARVILATHLVQPGRRSGGRQLRRMGAYVRLSLLFIESQSGRKEVSYLIGRRKGAPEVAFEGAQSFEIEALVYRKCRLADDVVFLSERLAPTVYRAASRCMDMGAHPKVYSVPKRRR